MPEVRLLKLNEENVARQKALVAAANQKKQAAKEAATASAASSSSKAATAGGRTRPRDSDETSNKRRSSAQADGSGRSSGAGASKRHRGNDASGGGAAGHGDDDEYVKRPEIKIQIPDSLKVQLVDDWENVTKLNKLVPLPKKPNVREVLKLYREYVVTRRKEGKSAGSSGSTNTAPIAVVDEVLKGLEVYFDKSLGNNLLYRYERQQFLQVKKGVSPSAAGGVTQNATAAAAAAAVTTASSGVEAGRDGTPTRKSKKDTSNAATDLEEDKQPSEIYGAEHLLRLFVNLPSIIAHTTMDVESVSILREHLDDFLQFMVKEKQKLFAKAYAETSAVYARLGST